MYVCEKCGCNDPRYFGIRNGKIYCRRCISFHGENALVNFNENEEETKEHLDYPLTLEQEEVSLRTKESFANGKNTLIYAVCGAGKTEITYGVISYALSQGKQVGFCIPRKDVVVELEERIIKAFPDKKVISVYGGHTKILSGDIILLTTHQLYRYNAYFDLLIIDETDAFPFSGNETLMNMFEKSVRGNYVMMSATPLEWMMKKIRRENGTYLTLMKRYHGHILPVPKIKILPFFKEIYITKKLLEYRKKGFPCFIFAPTIAECEEIYKFVILMVRDGNYVHSKREGREEIIKKFKEGKYKYLVTTSVLERGVTVKNIQVIVYNADSNIYSDAALVQISGRVGRKIDAYDGEVIFLCDKAKENVLTAIKKIKEANEYVSM